MGGGKEKELMAVLEEVLLGFGRSSGVVSVLWWRPLRVLQSSYECVAVLSPV